MTTPSPAQWQASRRFLGHEGRAAAACAESVELLHGRLQIGLTPLIGVVGFDTLFARSVNVAASKLSTLHAHEFRIESTSDGREVLTAYLARLDPAVATELAVAIFAALFALMTTFIGEKLADKILQQIGFPIAAPHSEENEP